MDEREKTRDMMAKIILAEDDEDMRRFLVRALEAVLAHQILQQRIDAFLDVGLDLTTTDDPELLLLAQEQQEASNAVRFS